MLCIITVEKLEVCAFMFFWCVLCEVSFRWYRPPNLTLGWWQSVWFIYACQILEKKLRNSKISGAKSLLLSRVGFSCWRCELFIFQLSSLFCCVSCYTSTILFFRCIYYRCYKICLSFAWSHTDVPSYRCMLGLFS